MQTISSPQTIPGKDLIDALARLTHDFKDACLIVPNGQPGTEFCVLAGFGAREKITCTSSGNCFDELKKFTDGRKAWLLGHFAYDLKNETEKLSSAHHDGIGFPLLHFFVPEYLVQADHMDGTVINAKDEQQNALFSNMLAAKKNAVSIPAEEKITLQPRTSKEEYLHAAGKLLQHIHRGDIYEINYCIEFYAEKVRIDPPSLFLRLNSLAEAPFSALYRNGNSWLMCASPERFLKKNGSRILSQPIKGTRPRGKTPEQDRALAEELRNDRKEQSENVMIVDLVRNDLSKYAKPGSVHVDELFGIYSFRTVHQMISTVSAEISPAVHPVDAIRHAFPMGSMTGAPKVRAMELAEEYETMRRGLYAGSVGYFTPGMDFDFNVVIRSIQYNAETGYLSLMVGSAITATCNPEKEYEECLLKAGSMFEAIAYV